MEQSKKPYYQTIAVSLVIMAFAAAAGALSLPMPGNAPIFPRMAAGFLFLCGLGLLIQAVQRWNRDHTVEIEAVDFRRMQSPLVILAMIVAYTLGFKYIGFYISTFIVTIAIMLYMGIRSAKTIVLVVGILMVFLYGLFTVQLQVPMPHGLLF